MLDIRVDKAVDWLRNNGLTNDYHIDLAVVCGSGIAGKMFDFVGRVCEWDYADIPGFPQITVEGHGGKLLLVEFLESKVLALVFSGRKHLYEGISEDDLLMQVRIVKSLNINRLVLTCSVGSLNRQTPPGSLGLIVDHIDFQQISMISLRGFSDIKHAPIYDTEFAEIIENSANKLKIQLVPGIFCSVLGPTYETPAEIGMLAAMGCDWVSMSTTKEAREAASLGLKVAGITGISNNVSPLLSAGEITTHEDVLKASVESSKSLWSLLSGASYYLG